MLTNTDIKKIPHDTLMLWGDKDTALDKEFPNVEKTFISGNVTIIHFPNASHNLHQQDKAGVWKEMIKFFKT